MPVMDTAAPIANLLAIERATLEDFFVWEAGLLDDWSLEEWLDCMAADGRYLIPSPSYREGDWKTSLFLVADDRQSLASRVRQLTGKAFWAAVPQPQTRRLVTNVRVLERGPEHILATANFAVWHFQNRQTDVYVGKYVHRFVLECGQLKILERKVILDHETLRPHGKIAIIL